MSYYKSGQDLLASIREAATPQVVHLLVVMRWRNDPTNEHDTQVATFGTRNAAIRARKDVEQMLWDDVSQVNYPSEGQSRVFHMRDGSRVHFSIKSVEL